MACKRSSSIYQRKHLLDCMKFCIECWVHMVCEIWIVTFTWKGKLMVIVRSHDSIRKIYVDKWVMLKIICFQSLHKIQSRVLWVNPYHYASLSNMYVVILLWFVLSRCIMFASHMNVCFVDTIDHNRVDG